MKPVRVLQKKLKQETFEEISKDVFIALVYNLMMCHIQVYVTVCLNVLCYLSHRPYKR